MISHDYYWILCSLLPGVSGSKNETPRGTARWCEFIAWMVEDLCCDLAQIQHLPTPSNRLMMKDIGKQQLCFFLFFWVASFIWIFHCIFFEKDILPTDFLITFDSSLNWLLNTWHWGKEGSDLCGCSWDACSRLLFFPIRCMTPGHRCDYPPGNQHISSKGSWENEFPFPVGYVNSLEGVPKLQNLVCYIFVVLVGQKVHVINFERTHGMDKQSIFELAKFCEASSQMALWWPGTAPELSSNSVVFCTVCLQPNLEV